jgi:hypothetical protein
MYKFACIIAFVIFLQFSFASSTLPGDQHWRYRWSAIEPWKDITEPCSPPDRANRNLLFLKLIRTNSEQTHLLIKEESFSFELVNEGNSISEFPAAQRI